MTPAVARQIEVFTPAKLNLGLEILSRRPDGYHDLATIFLTVDIFDYLTLTMDDRISLLCGDVRLNGDANLALQAVRALRDATGFAGGATLVLRKRIPIAAGLGGASSGAAASLLAARELWNVQVSDVELSAIGARLGSDVPFFLRGGCAIGHGRGDLLESLPVPAGIRFVIVAPALEIPNKTPTLYARLQLGDFSDGTRVGAQAARLRSGLELDSSLLANAFTRPLYALAPSLANLPGIMREAGAPSVAISGAGPTHYAPVADPREADRIASNLRDRLGNDASVFVAGPAPARCERSQAL